MTSAAPSIGVVVYVDGHWGDVTISAHWLRHRLISSYRMIGPHSYRTFVSRIFHIARDLHADGFHIENLEELEADGKRLFH